MNSSVVPLSQGQVIVSIPTGSTVSAGGANTSAVSPTSISSSAAAGLQRLAAQSQHVGFARSVVKLKCQHCNRLFATKPELLDYKVKHAFFTRVVYKAVIWVRIPVWEVYVLSVPECLSSIPGSTSSIPAFHWFWPFRVLDMTHNNWLLASGVGDLDCIPVSQPQCQALQALGVKMRALFIYLTMTLKQINKYFCLKKKKNNLRINGFTRILFSFSFQNCWCERWVRISTK